MIGRFLIAVIALLSIVSTVQAQPSLQQEDLCLKTGGVCRTINGPGSFIIDGFRTSAPRAGKLNFAWYGTAQCFNTSTGRTVDFGVIDFTVAIKFNGDSSPVSVLTPSAQRYAMRIPPAVVGTDGRVVTYSVPVTLAHNRMLSTGAAASAPLAQLVYVVNRIDPGVACNILQGQFTTLFTPNAS